MVVIIRFGPETTGENSKVTAKVFQAQLRGISAVAISGGLSFGCFFLPRREAKVRIPLDIFLNSWRQFSFLWKKKKHSFFSSFNVDVWEHAPKKKMRNWGFQRFLDDFPMIFLSLWDQKPATLPAHGRFAVMMAMDEQRRALPGGISWFFKNQKLRTLL